MSAEAWVGLAAIALPLLFGFVRWCWGVLRTLRSIAEHTKRSARREKLFRQVLLVHAEELERHRQTLRDHGRRLNDHDLQLTAAGWEAPPSGSSGAGGEARGPG